MTERRESVLFILSFCAAGILAVTGFASFPALMPIFFERWQLSAADAGWINGLYFGGYMLAVPVLVSLTDRADARLVFFTGCLLAVVSGLGFAFLAEGFWSALAWRFVAGMGLAGTYMPGLKAMTDRLEGAVPARAIAFYTACFSVGTSLSYLLAGTMAETLGLRWALVAGAAGPLVSFVIAALCWGAKAPSNPQPIRKILDFRPVLKNRRAMGYVLAYAAHTWELMALRAWMVAFLAFAASHQEGAPLLGVTTLATLVSLAGLPASVLGNELATRFRRQRVVNTIMLSSAALALLIGFSAGFPYWLVITLLLLYGVTVTADSASLTAGTVLAAEEDNRGATMAVHSFLGFGGGMIGPLVAGFALDLGGGKENAVGWGVAFASMGAGVLFGPLALKWMHREGGPGE